MDQLKGTIQNDILKEYIARGTYIFPPKESMQLITDIFAFCGSYIPKWNTISISGYHIREAGSTADTQEVAFTLANTDLRGSAIAQGLDVGRILLSCSFSLLTATDFFQEIAKFQAARTLWRDLMVERYYDHQKSKSTMLRFHTQVANCQSHRAATAEQRCAGNDQRSRPVIGGTQSLHKLDEALGLPTEASATVALRTQQIIAEDRVADTVDPIAGSLASSN